MSPSGDGEADGEPAPHAPVPAVVLAAVGAWAGALGGWRFGLVSLVVPLAGLVALVWATAGRRPVTGIPAVSAVPLVAAAAGVVTAALAAAAVQLPDDIVGRTVEIRATITSSSSQLSSQRDGAARTAVSATMTSWGAGTSRAAGIIPIKVFGAGDAWGHLAIGSEVSFRGKILPQDAPGRPVAVGAVTGPTVEVPPSGPDGVLDSVRSGLRDALSQGPADSASLVAGLAIGDESRQSPEFGDVMTASGLSHLTAVSGGNTAMVVLVVVMLCRLCRLAATVQVLGSVLALAGYVALVGPQPSVLRAAVMGGAGLLGLLLGGRSQALAILASATLILILVSPALATSLGFALSVAATAGLLVLAPVIAGGLAATPVLDRLPRGVVTAVAVTTAAQVTTAPLLLTIDSPLSWVAIPANLIVAPLVAPVTLLGLLAALLAPLGMAGIPARLALAPAEVIAAVAYRASSWGGGLTGAAGFVVFLLLVGGAVLRHLYREGALSAAFGFCGRASRRTGRTLVLMGFALVGGVLLFWLLTRPRPWVPPEWKAVICDVGQGTAVVLRSGDGEGLMVDVGPRDESAVDCLRAAGVDRLAAVVITHFHEDHIGGLSEVLATVPVGQILVTPVESPEEGASDVRAVAGEQGIPVVTVGRGQQLIVGTLSAQVLWPPPGLSSDDANNGSVVLWTRWEDGGSILTPGDVEPEGQSRMMAAIPTAPSDVVVIPHHGSAHQDERTVGWASPAVAVASAGAGNDYGHPSGVTMAAYEAGGARVVRTDEDGSVALSWERTGAEPAILVTTEES